jgi:predicted ester cyclase
MSGATRDPGSDWDLVDKSPDLIRPKALTVDARHDDETARELVRLAQVLYTFWNTGEVAYLVEAVSASFVDNTLPSGRPQGLDGISAASANFRAAVPDLTCSLDDLLVAGNKLAARLRFQGHFTGIFNGVDGVGQPIDFIAMDIQHAQSGRIVEDWHLEDNLTFLTQAGLATVIGS